MKKKTRKTENLIKKKGFKKEKKAINFSIKKYTKYIIAILLIIALFLSFLLINNLLKNRPSNIYTPVTDLEKYEYYVGPQDFTDRGLWVNIVDYYKLFDEDHRESDLYNSLFNSTDLKGMFPQGLILNPVMLAYDSFDPYDDSMSYEKLEEYKCETDNSDFEIQLSIISNANITNSYEINKDENKYIGNASLSLSNITYYLNDNFDPSIDNEILNESSDFITPYFNFDYVGNATSYQYDENNSVIGEIYTSFEGSLNNTNWNFTADIVSNGQGIFKNGSAYVRCKIPCTITKTFNGNTESYDDICYLYLEISDVRLGSWYDCMPDTSKYGQVLEQNTETESEMDILD